MFTIDKMSRTPIYEQLISRFETSILSGEIGPEGKLPSVRYLSQHLGINPNTLQRAYLEIERRGLCYSVPGNGRFLSKDALEKLRAESLLQTEALKTQMCSLKEKGVTKSMMLDIVNSVYDTEDYERKVLSE